MTLPFFGLGPDYRAVLHREIYYLMKHLNGGMTHTEIWNMPRSLRMFYVRMVSDDIKRHNEHIEEQNKKIKSAQSKIPNMRRNVKK